ncbi:hypothetical protein MKW98_031790, partial [Papaver atlanticum]
SHHSQEIEAFGVVLLDQSFLLKAVTDGGGDCSVRRFRGPASLKFLDTLQPGQRFQVESLLNSPVGGQNSDYLSMYITHLARDGNKLPLTVAHWSYMPFKFILNAMAEIKYTTLEERLAHRPNDVVKSQWMELVEFWQNPKQQERCAGCKANRSKRTAQQSTGARPHEKNAAQLAAKLKRAPTAKEIYDATHKKRKKQMEGLESKSSQRNSKSSSKKMKMSAEASGSRRKKAKTIKAESDESLEGFGSVGKPVEAARVTSSAFSAEPVEAVKTTTSTSVSGRESDEELEFVDNFQIPKEYTVLCKKTIKAESDESLEDFGSVVGKPDEPARMTSSAFSTEPVEAAKTTSSAEPVEAAKTTSSVKCPTVDSKLVSSSPAKEISAPFVRSTSVSVRGNDEEFEFVDNFKIPKEYAVLYKKIFKKYGHMATKKVIKSNDTILVAFVSSLLEMISAMETTRGADLSDSLLQTWEGDIEDVENLGFNVKWLREKFDEVKKNWKSSSGIHKEVEIHEKELDATQVKYASLLARKGRLYQEFSEVIIEIREAETKISSEKKTIQEMLAPENNFLDEPILGKLLS